MASLGHVAVGMVAGRLYGGSSRRSVAVGMGVFALLAMLPDFDVLLLALGHPDRGMLGHRGASHSLGFAALLACLAWYGAGRWKLNRFQTALFVFVTVASHGLLDGLTYDSRGVPMLWPLMEDRFASPWRPIPVAPTGMAFISLRGLEVATVELIYFSPMVLYALWPRRGPTVAPSPSLTLVRGSFVLASVLFCLLLAELTMRETDWVARLERPARLRMLSAPR